MNLKPTAPQVAVERPPRLAAIDIGTNSIRCIIAEVDPDERFRVLDDERAMVRLGEGLNATGRISAAASQRAAEVLNRMTKIIRGLGASQIEAVATSAVRKAGNGQDFIEEMHARTGIDIRVISGEEEAELAALSARHNFDMKGNRFAMVDIGGGSVESVEATGEHTENILSLELGAVYLSERFISSDPVSEKELKRLRKHVRATLKQHAVGQGLPVTCLIGSGGSMTNIGGMAMAMRDQQYESVHRYEVLRSEVIHLRAMLERMNQKERRAVPGLNPQRADIMLAGLVLTEEVMRCCRSNLLLINHKGIREGLILTGLRRHGLLPEDQRPRDWRSAVEEFARSCRYDEHHARQVCRLATSNFQAVAGAAGLEERDRDLLEAAALLHDIGYFISYDRHHKHSYHLIRHANLFGFTPRERELIANIARYHRKGKPKQRHDSFAQLAADDRQKVSRLGGILRLADGLDRRRNGQVSELTGRINGHTLEIELLGAGDLSVEIYGGQVKGDLFRRAFGLRLVVDEG